MARRAVLSGSTVFQRSCRVVRSPLSTGTSDLLLTVCIGLRIGFITAPEAVLVPLNYLSSNTNLQVSSTTQVIALKLLQHMGVEGFVAHGRRFVAEIVYLRVMLSLLNLLRHVQGG
jgi:hypothetical protein